MMAAEEPPPHQEDDDMVSGSEGLLSMCATASAYLLASVLTVFPAVINRGHHHRMTVAAVATGCCRRSWSSTLARLAGARVRRGDWVWVLGTHVGSVGFALLGEVPFLTNIVITPGWLGRLSPPAVVVTVLITVLVVAVGVRQTRESVRLHRCSKKCGALTAGVLAYAVVYAIIVADGTSAHFHIHHAIFAGFLSLYFGDLVTWVDRLTHGVLIGVVAEGICFYGSTEYDLLSSTTVPCPGGRSSPSGAARPPHWAWCSASARSAAAAAAAAPLQPLLRRRRRRCRRGAGGSVRIMIELPDCSLDEEEPTSDDDDDDSKNK